MNNVRATLLQAIPELDVVIALEKIIEQSNYGLGSQSIEVVNGTSDNLDYGSVVGVKDVDKNGVMTVEAFAADGTKPDRFCLGVLPKLLRPGEPGYVVKTGFALPIDTTGIPHGEIWSDEQMVYASVSPGELTKTAPTQSILIGTVIRAGTNGAILL